MKTSALSLLAVLCCLPLFSLSHPLLRVRKQLISDLVGTLCDPRGAVPAPSNCPGVSYGRDVKLSFFSHGPNVCQVQQGEYDNVEYRYELVFVNGAKGVSGETTYCIPKCLSGPRPSGYNPIVRSRCCKGFAYKAGERGCAQDLSRQTLPPPTTAATTAPPTTAATTAPPTTAATTAPPTTATTTASPTTAATTAPPTTATATTPPATTAATTELTPTTELPTATVEDMSKLVGECLFFSARSFHGVLNLKQDDPLSETTTFGRLRNLYGSRFSVFVHEFPDIYQNCQNIGGFFPAIGSIANARKSRFSYYANASGKTVIPVSLLVGRSLSIVDKNGRIQACCEVKYPM